MPTKLLEFARQGKPTGENLCFFSDLT